MLEIFVVVIFHFLSTATVSDPFSFCILVIMHSKLSNRMCHRLKQLIIFQCIVVLFIIYAML